MHCGLRFNGINCRITLLRNSFMLRCRDNVMLSYQVNQQSLLQKLVKSVKINFPKVVPIGADVLQTQDLERCGIH